MKALAFNHPQMVGKNATVIDTTEEGWTFEGKRMCRLGVLGPAYIEVNLVELLKKRPTLDSQLLVRMATYQLTETSWTILFSVEGLEGVFHLRRKPGETPLLTYVPLNGEKALVVSHRSIHYRLYNDVHDANEALERYAACYKHLKTA